LRGHTTCSSDDILKNFSGISNIYKENRANSRERQTEANFLRWEDGLTKFSTKKVEIDENLEVGNGMSEGARSWMKFGKQNPLSCLDVFCGAMILSGLPTPSEQG
jgi:hypothetical protein